ncbi:MAG: hypothetical protein K9J12_12415 [Melioribacteraceae bacterium]|nr:hypothetical protein [Melioribacteraceae bacterium]MCF8414543.1 hypothetical protein [Melioribacteraceae bacterium]
MKKTDLEKMDMSATDIVFDVVKKALKNGYIHAWFTWLEWITITSVIFIAAAKLDDWFLNSVAWLSTVIGFVSGLVVVEDISIKFFPWLTKRPAIAIVIALIINLVGLIIIFSIVFGLLNAIKEMN